MAQFLNSSSSSCAQGGMQGSWWAPIALLALSATFCINGQNVDPGTLEAEHAKQLVGKVIWKWATFMAQWA
jgi:hypothetical protein